MVELDLVSIDSVRWSMMGFHHPSFVERLVFTLQSILQLLGICALMCMSIDCLCVTCNYCYCYKVLQLRKGARFQLSSKRWHPTCPSLTSTKINASLLFNHDDVASTPSSPLLRCPTHVDGGRQHSLFGRAFLY